MRSDLDFEFVAILRRYQEDEAISCAELARRLEVSPQYVSKLFSEEYPSSLTFKTATGFLDRLGFTPHLIYSRNREKIPA